MTMYNVSGLRGPAVGKVEVAKAPIPAANVMRTGAEQSVAASVVYEKQKADTNRAVEKVRAAMNAAGADIPQQAELLVRVDKDANRYVYEFRDPVNKKVIRQYPDKEVLAALAAYRQEAVGVAVDEIA
jgi:uncharacterized FlaG/YvyC family protein